VVGSKLFVIVSDDPKWCRQHLGATDVVIASKSAEHDLALLSSCNHTIIDYGTFGYWGAIMAGGHTISLNVDQDFNSIMAQNKNWHVYGTFKHNTSE
jgi:galactoside 2-L-fucosyltransferase 1/2